jgi:hypothetical protein
VSSTASRHVSASTLEEYHAKGVNGVLVVPGTPTARIQISPAERKLRLLTQAARGVSGPNLIDRAHLAYDLLEEDGSMWQCLEVDYQDNLPEVYPVICAILDRVQVEGQAFTDAVEAVLHGLNDVLAGRGGLTHEQQVGLFGELIVLLARARLVTASRAVVEWRGPTGEEHDFGLTDDDVEVKTTVAEQRSHWINGLTQLQPTPGRNLYLLSIQLTAAGAGAGATLPELVEKLRALPDVPLSDADAALAQAGYRNHHADLYNSRWALRSAPAFYLVDDAFPALTPSRLAQGVPRFGHIGDVRYRVDLAGLVAAAPLFASELEKQCPHE